jgi:hypothetical protein
VDKNPIIYSNVIECLFKGLEVAEKALVTASQLKTVLAPDSPGRHRQSYWHDIVSDAAV